MTAVDWSKHTSRYDVDEVRSREEGLCRPQDRLFGKSDETVVVILNLISVGNPHGYRSCETGIVGIGDSFMETKEMLTE